VDVHSPKQRSYNMSRIKGKDTKPEMVLRQWLWRSGYRYRLHRKDLPGKPDIVFPGLKNIIFVHGCFWHKHNCKYFKWPASNAEFWKNKIKGNIKRDNKHYKALSDIGWNYLTVWECELNSKNQVSLWKKVRKFLDSKTVI